MPKLSLMANIVAEIEIVRHVRGKYLKYNFHHKYCYPTDHSDMAPLSPTILVIRLLRSIAKVELFPEHFRAAA